jgi:hypothetical protein
MYEHVVASSHCSGVLDTVVEHAGNAGQRAEVSPRFPTEELTFQRQIRTNLST